MLKYMTDGCLLREQLVEKSLSRYSALVLDEAHERGLDTVMLYYTTVGKMVCKLHTLNTLRCVL